MLPDLQSLLKEAEALQGRMDQVRARLGEIRLQGSAADGEITVTVNGLLEVLDINISLDAADKFNLQEIEQHVKTAVNQALQMAQTQAATEMEKVSGNLNPAKLLQSLQGFGK